MKKEEILNWIKSAKFITYSHDEYDANGNRESYAIYEKDGKLFELFYNDLNPAEKYVEGVGYIRGECEDPVEVREIEEEIIVTRYVPVKKEE